MDGSIAGIGLICSSITACMVNLFSVHFLSMYFSSLFNFPRDPQICKFLINFYERLQIKRFDVEALDVSC